MEYKDGRAVINGKTDGRTAAWAAKLTLETPEDIARLPWAGNHYSDSELFRRVTDYIKVGLSSKKDQKRALYLMGYHGMGFSKPVTDKELADFLAA